MKERKYRRTKRHRRFIFIVVAIYTLISAAAVGILLSYIKSLPPIEELENYRPPQMSEVYNNTETELIARFSIENREVVSFQDIPKNLTNAFIAIEDARFYEHCGIDVKRFISSLIINIKRKSFAQGASTITMQIPRNLLPDITKEKKISRKIKEMLLALKIESSYSKEQIMEFYLNQIWLGKSSYGVKAAARSYFNKELSELSLAECASLAAIPQRPGKYSPLLHPENNISRRNIILAYMLKYNFINQQEYNEAIKERLILNPPPPLADKAPYFVDYLHRELIKDTEYGVEDIKTKGLKIFSTVDMQMQTICNDEMSSGLREVEKKCLEVNPARFYAEDEDENLRELKSGQVRLAKIVDVSRGSITVIVKGITTDITLPEVLPYYDPSEVVREGKYIDILINKYDPARHHIEASLYDQNAIQGAIVILDAKTGNILALVGGDNFYDKDNKGMWNRAILAERQPGSCFKPFVFTTAFDNGYNLNTVLIDEELKFSDGYTPKNYENRYFGPTTLMEALEHSRNVVTIKLFLNLGMNKAIKQIGKFDVPGLGNPWKMDPIPTLSLGSLSVTPLELTAAYLPYVNKGVIIEPKSIKRITDGNGKVLKVFKPYEKVVCSAEAAYMTAYALRGVVERGTAVTYIGGRFLKDKDAPFIAGKTGTTDDCNDTWFIGFTPDLVIGVFVGYDQNRTLGPQMTGGRIAGPIWANVLDRILKLKNSEDWKKKLDVPQNIVTKDICARSGQVAKPTCSDGDGLVYYNMPFKKGTEPSEQCTTH